MSLTLFKANYVAKANISGARKYSLPLVGGATKSYGKGEIVGAMMQSTTVGFRETRETLKLFTKMYCVRLFFWPQVLTAHQILKGDMGFHPLPFENHLLWGHLLFICLFINYINMPQFLMQSLFM